MTTAMIETQIHPAVDNPELPVFLSEDQLPSRDGDRIVQFREALREAMSEEMRKDKRVFLLGEEVAQYNGAYKISQGMLDEFGVHVNLWENPYISPAGKLYEPMRKHAGSHMVWLGIVPDYTLAEARKLLTDDPKLETDRGQAARVLLWLMEQDQAIRFKRGYGDGQAHFFLK